MDLSLFLTSINKLSLGAFLIVIGGIGYEIYIISRENKHREKPIIPSFSPNQNTVSTSKNSSAIVIPKTKLVNHNLVILIVLILMLMVLGIVTIVSLLANKKTPGTFIEPRIIVNEIKSKGIRMFDLNWNEYGAHTKISPNTTVIIAVETIAGTDIDSARIRVNSIAWRTEDVTSQFNTNMQLFYKEFKIASGETKLKIEAQLHSRQDGWLGQ